MWAMYNDALLNGGSGGTWKAVIISTCVGHTSYVLKSIAQYSRVVLDTHTLKGR